jgi:hypothetical protein
MQRDILRFGPIALTLAILLAGCGEVGESGSEAKAAELSATPAGVVDSVFPIEEEIRRFEATVPEEATALSGGAATREELVSGFIQALERSDTAALARMVIDRSEFIYLYFPHTAYTAPPYELDPEIVWFQMLNNSSRGITRAYRAYAGRELDYRGHRCATTPTIEGPNRVWERCAVQFAPDGGVEVLRLFGLILERDGQFKFVTYGNDL